MENCQNNMRYSRQGNMYSARAGYNMACNSSRMDSGVQRRMNSNTCGFKTECSQECRKTEECNRREEKKSCGCHREDSLSGLPLAMAYVPWQEWRKIYDVCEGFHRGTIFEELDLPFRGKGGCNR